MPDVPDVVLMKRCGSCTQFTPALKLCASPAIPVAVQLTSSRNCHLSCSVVCGAVGFEPVVTPFGNIRYGRALLPGMAFLKSANWKMNSLSFVRPNTQLSFTLTELKLLRLIDHVEGAARSAGPFGCELVSRLKRPAR